MLVLMALLGCRPVLEPRVSPPSEDPSAAWEATLAEVVTVDGWVDYDALAERRDALDAYVAWIARPRSPRRSATRHAFMLNAYNALVLYAALEDGPPDSVLAVDGVLPWPGSGFFFERAFLVDGHPTSLWEIQHENLRNKVLDYRDHAALNRATASSPPLRRELYRSRGLQAQLDRQMSRWIMDDARGVRIEGGVAVFSPIFDRFAWDFEFLTVGDDLCTTAARYATGEKKQQLRALARQGCPHRFFAFDPSLNDASRSSGHVEEASDEPVEGLGGGGAHTDED